MKSYNSKLHFTAWTDGSANVFHHAKPGGAAYIIFDNKGTEIKRASKGFVHTTNNRMENLAIISVVNSLPYNASVTVYTDSQYCIMALNSKKPKKNLDQIRTYHRICKDRNIKVQFKWIKGHSGNKYNELCDQMAKKEYNKMASQAEETYYSSITTKGSWKARKGR